MDSKYIDLDEMKKIELDILVKFHEFCVKNDIKYFLFAGTLLGAVRHQGFIPWDDDIDLMIPRPDYERLLELCKTPGVIDKQLEVLTFKENPYYPYPFAKVCDKRTICDVPGLDKRTGLGVWIDLFPIDGLPGDDCLKEAHIAKLQKKIRILNRCSRKFYFSKNLDRMLKNIAIKLLYGVYNRKKVLISLDALAKKYPYDDSKEAGVIAFCSNRGLITSHAMYDEKVELIFEGHRFYAPKEYIDYLVGIYGENCYKELPPLSERQQAHDITARWKEM